MSFAIYVGINVKPEHADAFIELSVVEGRIALRDEPGCTQFDIARDVNDPNRICFFEVFVDREALDTHWATPNFVEYWEKVESMVVDFERVEMVVT